MRILVDDVRPWITLVASEKFDREVNRGYDDLQDAFDGQCTTAVAFKA